MNQDHILTYSFSTLAVIAQDIEKRNYYYKKVTHLFERKSEIDSNYSNHLENLINKENIKNIKPEIPSQYLYSMIVELIQQQIKRIRTFSQGLKLQILRMSQQHDKQNTDIKKSLILSQSITKDILNQKQKLQKSKHKFQRKNKQLESSKIQYLVSFLNNEQLQKKNLFFLNVSNLEQSIKPLKQSYQDSTNKYNELIEVNMSQIDSILSRIELIQYKKINLLKDVIGSYLKNQKNLIDQTLRGNPFRIAKVDSIRQIDEFKVHSQQDLLKQKQELLIGYSNEAAFINKAYDRMQIKKNLAELILSGQTREYRQQITKIFNKQQSLQISKLNPKTIRIIQIFKDVFQGQIKENIFDEFKSLILKEELIRKDFMICLQKYRINNQFQLKFRNKEHIIACLNIFLDVCSLELDTYNSKMLMILSLTYNFQDGDGTQTELQELIKHHSIWKHIGWWQTALLESIFEETRVKIKKQELPINIWDIKAGGINRKQQGQELSHQHICFNQMIYYVRNMNLFQVEPKSIYQFAKDNINLFKFSGKFSKDILEICPKIPHQSC